MTQQLTVDLRQNRERAGLYPWAVQFSRGNDKPAAFFYVDDTTLFDAVGTDQAKLHLTAAVATATFEGLELESDLLELKRRAEVINMKINAKKIQLLVISPQNGYIYSAAMNQEQGDKIESVSSLKLVGLPFGFEPNAAAHVETIRESFRRRLWMLYNRRAGFKGRIL